MGLTAGKKDHAEAGAAGAPGSEIRGSAGTNTGTSRVRSGGDGATSCLSPALVNKGLCQHRDHSGQQTQPLAPMGMRRPQARQRAVREDENLAPLVLQQLRVRMGRPITMDMFSNTMMLLA
jgi:hypothetical protein